MHRPTRAAIALAVAAVTLLPLQLTAQAADDERFPPPWRCLDVVEPTHVTFTERQEPDLLGGLLGQQPTPASISASIHLAAPSCTDATYRVDVWAFDGDDGIGPLLAQPNTQGDGTSAELTITAELGGYAGDCVAVQIVTHSNNRSPFGDLAPDTDPALEGGGCGGGGGFYN